MPKRSDKPKREMTRRQLSHWQKENRISRITLIVGSVIVVAVLAIVGTGIYLDRFKDYRQTVIRVGNTSFNMDYYIDMLAFYGRSTGQDYVPYVTDLAAQKIQQIKIINDAAAKLNPPVTVSDDEVEKTIRERSLPNKPTYRDVVRDELLVQKLRTGYFDQQVPASGEQRNVQAMFLDSQTEVSEVKARLDKGENFNSIAGEISRESTSKSKNGDIGFVPKGILPSILGTTGNTTVEETVFSSNTTVNQLYAIEDPGQSKNVGWWLLEVTERREVQATTTPTPTASETPAPVTTNSTELHVLAMLLNSKEKALEIKAKMEVGGEGNDWGTLAKANSSYPNAADNGGDLGFISKGTLGGGADEVLFPADPAQGLELNKVSNPIADSSRSGTGGFWLVKVTEIDPNRPIEGENRTKLVDAQINAWGQQQVDSNLANLQVSLTDAQKQFAVTQALKRMS